MLEKRLNLWGALFIIGLMLIGVGDKALAANASKGRITVVTSLPLVKDIAEKVGGERIKAESITQSAHCEHQFEVGPKELKRLARCGIYIKLGMGADNWADKLKGILRKDALFVDASRGIKTVKVNGLVNPHYWGNPENVKIMAKNILDALVKRQPSFKAYFMANYRCFLQEINRTSNELKAQVAKLSRKEFVSYSNAFAYFFEYFGFKNLLTVELSCEQEISPKDMALAVKLMREKKIKVLVGDAAEPEEPEGLVRETGAKLVLLWPTTDTSGEYLTTLRQNVKLMVEALK